MSLVVRARPALQGGMKQAALLALPEAEFGRRIQDIEAAPLFRTLLEAGAVCVQPASELRFVARRLAGRELPVAPDSGLDALRDSTIVDLLAKVGGERFERHFLGEESLSDADCVRLCGISSGEVLRLRRLADELELRRELGSQPAAAATARVSSVVAEVRIEEGRPALAFFYRSVWRTRYRVNAGTLDAFVSSLPPSEARRASSFVRELQEFDRRKTTLLQVLEAVLEAQRAYFLTADRAAMQPFGQANLAARLEVCPSVISRLIGNKAVRAPWGVDLELRGLFPTRKSLLRDAVFTVLEERPTAKDHEVRAILAERTGVVLSRRSLSQYRTDLGIGSWRQRTLAIRGESMESHSTRSYS